VTERGIITKVGKRIVIRLWETTTGENYCAPSATNSRRLVPARVSLRHRISPAWFGWAGKQKAGEAKE